MIYFDAIIKLLNIPNHKVTKITGDYLELVLETAEGEISRYSIGCVVHDSAVHRPWLDCD